MNKMCNCCLVGYGSDEEDCKVADDPLLLQRGLKQETLLLIHLAHLYLAVTAHQIQWGPISTQTKFHPHGELLFLETFMESRWGLSC